MNPVAWRNEVDVRFAPKPTQLRRSSEMTGGPLVDIKRKTSVTAG